MGRTLGLLLQLREYEGIEFYYFSPMNSHEGKGKQVGSNIEISYFLRSVPENHTAMKWCIQIHCIILDTMWATSYRSAKGILQQKVYHIIQQCMYVYEISKDMCPYTGKFVQNTEKIENHYF